MKVTNIADRFDLFSLRSSPPELFCKKSFLKNFAKFVGKHLRRGLLNEKETPIQALSCKFCKIFKNTSIFEENCRTAAPLH